MCIKAFTIPISGLPIANFSANTTSGNSPLNVQFTDLSESEDSRSWDFGDETNSTEQNPFHTYTTAGNYTVNLTVINENGTDSKSTTITVQEYKVLPVANFDANPISGYAPLTVLFTDNSQNAAGWSWNFGDGTTSTDQSPSHTYSSAGTYTVNLVVSNANGTSLASTTINVNSWESSSSSSSSSGGSGGGGAGGSPEPSKNVQVKELSQAFITNGKPVMFDFPQNATCVVYVSFDSKKTAGKTTTIAEQLKNKSSLVSELNSGEVYKYFNVWVGTGGFATSKNIENPVVCFKVEKAWIKDKNIDKSSITLNRYNDKKWSHLPVKLLNEDSKYLYFTAETPEFSFFVITGIAKPSGETGTGIQLASNETINENDTENKELQNQQNEILKTPGFEIYYGIASLFAVLLYKRK